MLLLLAGCFYDVEEELYPTIECHPVHMRYNSDIVPILNRHCYSCHSEAAHEGNVVLVGYENLMEYVQNGSLMGSIKHEPGWSFMPKDRTKMPVCDIRKIEVWIAEGSLEN